ncbi:exopolysaccharide biosynthesis polyprenyl glycosylphosphotransferase [Empedobacter sp. GD03644]|uniref:Exopolysaccharide biosynthesis polyprenyl glycosylphosphotransferase n=2 Tax=Weeksellaceae TaxID=2762318 RepID=A0A7H9DYF2_9FLAO|nr:MULTISPECIES: exopolysaccharide biosynthesis polyprenyl glycosylphosphotransferase [Empedobacter]MDH2207361.1 exopolysaccharide biosynthesis polyprenyl glycosylphosphotransferase [Empedobacter sp. GD03644]QLL59696.1 exopolysaccharide biosynthesis polyprenyl glycosylphosphotransferase [Empedobacter falsenii]
MYRRRNWFLYFVPQMFDFICVISFFLIFVRLQYIYFYPKEHLPLMHLPSYLEVFEAHYKALFLLLLSWIIISQNIKLYEDSRKTKLIKSIKRVFLQLIYFSVILFAISGLKEYDLMSFYLGLIYISILLVLMICFRVFIFFYRRSRHKAGLDLMNVLIVDENINTKKFVEIVESRKELGFNLTGNFSQGNKFELLEDKLVYDKVDVESFIVTNDIHHIFISQFGTIDKNVYRKLSILAEQNHIELNYIPYSIYNNFTNLKIDYIDTLPILEVKRFPLDLSYNQFIKFCFDKLFALFICLFILSWLIPIISLLVFIDSKGPIFFIQKRNGLNGNEFGCIKFRTMRHSKLNSIKATVRNDDRITKVGSFLRKTSLDEMPQFINVLLGDMSIVGPRPHMISQDSYYKEIIEKYNLRHYVKPGITGLSQVKGYRGAIDSDLDMEKRIFTDVYYVRNWSFLLDIQIIYLTILLVVKGDENAI